MVGDTMSQRANNANWPRFVRNSVNRKLHLFVYNVDSLKAYKNIDTLNARKIYKRLDYSEEELNKLNWIVVIKD